MCDTKVTSQAETLSPSILGTKIQIFLRSFKENLKKIKATGHGV